MFVSSLFLSTLLLASSPEQQPDASAPPVLQSKQESMQGKTSDGDRALQAKAAKVAKALASSDDPQLKQASCELLGNNKKNPSLQDLADDTVQICATDSGVDSSVRARILALTSEVQVGKAAALDELRRLGESLMKSNPTLAVDAVASLPGTDGTDELSELLGSNLPEVRERAANALSAKSPEEARKLVERASKGQTPADVGFQAALGLARTGDRDEVKRVSGWLPQLQGQAQLQAADALAQAGMGEGATVLAKIAQQASDDMLQIQAARALVDLRPDITAQVVERGLVSPNVWIRAEAAALAPRLGPAWSERVQELLSDSSSWVRLQAAAGVLGR